MPRLSGPALDELFGPVGGHDAIGLAVSGGADSLALMLLADAWAATHPLAPRLFVYTVDHGLRVEAAGEVAFVAAEAEKLGLGVRVLRWIGDKPATGVQEAAREARYRLIAEAMHADGATLLLTAHHLHDQAETVLMRLAHGSGIEGLGGIDGIAHVDGLKIYRPFLATDPAKLHAVVAAAGIVPVADPSNLDPHYERVRWRRLMPQLAALGLDAARIAQFARRMHDADVALDSALSEANALVETSEFLDRAVFPRALLQRLPRAVAIRLVRHTLRWVGSGNKPYALGAVETLTDRLIAGPVRATLGGCLIQGGGRTVRIETEPLIGARARAKNLAAT